MAIIDTYEEQATELNIKQVIILRTDLNMRKGKMVAQGSHASNKYLFDHSNIKLLDGEEHLVFKLDLFWKSWIFGNFKKIVQGVNSEEHLLEIYNYLSNNTDIPVSLVTDNGLTEFNGIPTNTAIGIGPFPAKEIDRFTGKDGLFSDYIRLL